MIFIQNISHTYNANQLNMNLITEYTVFEWKCNLLYHQHKPAVQHPPLLSSDVHTPLNRWCSNVGLYQWSKTLQNQLQIFTSTRNIPGGEEPRGSVMQVLQFKTHALPCRLYPWSQDLRFLMSLGQKFCYSALKELDNLR